MLDISQTIADTIYGWANIALAIGAALVLFGTIGVIWSGGVRERFANERISSNETKTAQAVADAATAHAASEVAKADAARANENFVKAKQSIATANERAAKLENEAEQARLETERLKRQFAWRRLNETQFHALATGFSEIIGLNLVLSAVGSDPESMLFATDIKRAMAAAGINLEIRGSVFLGQRPVVGINISGPREAIIRVGKVFTQAGFNVEGYEQPNAKEVEILIGSKPPPIE